MVEDRRRLVTGLIVAQVADAIFNAIPSQWLRDDLDHLGVPRELRLVFPVVKSASAVGLLVGFKRPALGRATAWALVVYFVLAMGAHARVKDPPLKLVPAAAMLAWSMAAAKAFRVR